MANPARIILIDGTALIYRAYFAIPASFTTAQGLHTNAIYGFATMFRKMLAGRQPEYGAVVFDAPGATFREEKFPAYKAQRPGMEDDLREQLPHIDRLVAAQRFPTLRVPGFEADDVIGTLTRMALEAGHEVFIVSGDKDFAQLINDRVRMIDTLRDITYDPELVRKKWGVPPERFVDLLALMGDSSDNIPGVPGIGQKGAAELLLRFGSLDGILEHVGELKGRQQKTLSENRDQAILSRDLATIDQKVPLDKSLSDLRLEPVEPAALNELYRELEFFSLLSQEETVARADAPEGTDYAAVTDLEALTALVDALPRDHPTAVLAIADYPSPVSGKLAGLALSTAAGHARFIPIDSVGGLGANGLDRLRAWLEDAGRPKVSHNAKWLWVALRRKGITLRGITGDVMLESFLVDPNKLIPHNLDQIVKEYLHRTVAPAKSILGAGQKERTFSELTAAELTPWAGQQADAVLAIAPLLRERLEAEGHLKCLMEVDLPLSWVLGAMELAGIAVDRDDLAKMTAELRDRLGALEARVYELAGHEFNIGSTKQLSAVLFDELKLPVVKRTKSGYSTDADVLEKLARDHEIANVLLEQRKLAKLINTYTDVLPRVVNPETGRIHATFQQTVGVTGRLITTEPDLQRTPIKTPEGRRIRQCFVPAPGMSMKLISADWSQIELRLLAHFTRDPNLVDAFRNNLDVHRRTAGQLFDCEPGAVTAAQRGIGKLVNFATIYGQGATALGQILGVPRKEAQSYIDRYFAAYAGVRTWLDETIAKAHETGYVTTLLGRRRYITELKSNNFMDRQTGERIAANTPIQGSAADLCKLAMLAIDRGLRDGKLATRMLLQIHDELVFEAPEAEVERVVAIVRDAMEHPCPLDVPLVVEVGVGASWGDAH